MSVLDDILDNLPEDEVVRTVSQRRLSGKWRVYNS